MTSESNKQLLLFNIEKPLEETLKDQPLMENEVMDKREQNKEKATAEFEQHNPDQMLLFEQKPMRKRIQKLDFKSWLEELNRKAPYIFPEVYSEQNTPESEEGIEVWSEYYADGYSPEDSLREYASYWN